MKTLRIFNTASLLHFTENDRVLSAQLLEMALSDMPVFFKKASESNTEQSPEDSARWIHKLKGVSGTTGADIIHHQSMELEEKLKSGTPASDEEFRLLGAAIESFCSNADVAAWIADV